MRTVKMKAQKLKDSEIFLDSKIPHFFSTQIPGKGWKEKLIDIFSPYGPLVVGPTSFHF